jgi:hypothetical protein
MAAQSEVAHPAEAASWTSTGSRVYADGLIAGLVGATVIALWFLVLDALAGRPFYTPTVLGTALFRGGEGLESPGTLPVDFEVVMSFTWVHVLTFLVIGVAASRLIALAERDSNFGFGVVLLFVVFSFGFVLACMVFAGSVLRAIPGPTILIGNLLAAAAMTAVFRRRHPDLHIEP